jgi:hypothetical protein
MEGYTMYGMRSFVEFPTGLEWQFSNWIGVAMAGESRRLDTGYRTVGAEMIVWVLPPSAYTTGVRER